MSISGVAAIGGASTSSGSIESQIAQLRKQETALNKQLRDLATSNADAKTKETKQELLTAQIQVIEAQIAQLVARQAEAAQQGGTATGVVAQQAAASKSESVTDAADTRAFRPIDGNGYQVDVEL